MAEYYTPTLEDFTIGFEYEFLTGGVEWKKFVFDMDRPQAVLENVRDYPTTFRVKYLDEEDLKELGINGISRLSKSSPHNITLYEIDETKGLQGIRNVLFKGTIKNKSELRRILKQVGIIK